MIGITITQLRKAAGLTQEELAEKAGVTVRTIQRIENNNSMPRAYTLRQIAEALGLSVQELTKTTVAECPPYDEKEKHWELRWLNLSCFTYLFIPFVHVLIPYYLWKKNQSEAGRKIIAVQITWTIALHGLLLLALAVNLAMFHFLDKAAWFISYLWLALAMYAVNALMIIRTHVRIMSGKCRA